MSAILPGFMTRAMEAGGLDGIFESPTGAAGVIAPRSGNSLLSLSLRFHPMVCVHYRTENTTMETPDPPERRGSLSVRSLGERYETFAAETARWVACDAMAGSVRLFLLTTAASTAKFGPSGVFSLTRGTGNAGGMESLRVHIAPDQWVLERLEVPSPNVLSGPDLRVLDHWEACRISQYAIPIPGPASISRKTEAGGSIRGRRR